MSRVEVILNDSLEKPSITNETQLQKEQDISSKHEKLRKVSFEAILKDNADLVDERTFNYAREEVCSFISRSSR